VFVLWFLISVALCISGSIIISVIVNVNLLAKYHAMYKLAVYVVFTVLCILCMAVSERMCFPSVMKSDTHMLTTLKLGKRLVWRILKVPKFMKFIQFPGV
jgi:hypothetical protein